MHSVYNIYIDNSITPTPFRKKKSKSIPNFYIHHVSFLHFNFTDMILLQCIIYLHRSYNTNVIYLTIKLTLNVYYILMRPQIIEGYRKLSDKIIHCTGYEPSTHEAGGWRLEYLPHNNEPP